MKKAKKIFKGIIASTGKYYGKSLKLISSSHIILQKHIEESGVQIELSKFIKALENSKKYLEETIKTHSNEIDKDLYDLMSAQMDMIDDPLLKKSVESRITKQLENAPLALFNTVKDISNKLLATDNAYMKERAQDIMEIGRIIEDRLISKSEDNKVFSQLKEDVIIVSRELTPMQILKMDKSRIRGIITEKGGSTGHLAIVAKNYQIPALVGLEGILEHIEEDEFILLNADQGVVIKNPAKKDIEECLCFIPLKKPSKVIKSAVSKDGIKVLVKVNLEEEGDCAKAIELGVDGVGLYRSESIVMVHPDNNPSEDEQFAIYKNIVSSMNKMPVRIRTYDLGADKFDVDQKEENPFLGCRGIRFCLQHPRWFKKQLKALLRASAYGNLEIMLPMVSSASEIQSTQKLIQECEDELSRKKQPYSKYKLGVMVETPSAAIALDILCKESDFLSLGTNDLLQYIMAVDRNNAELSELYNPYHIAFLRVIQSVINFANNTKVPLGICGELASDPLIVRLLMGMGLREFSVSLPLVQKVKEIVCDTDIGLIHKECYDMFKLAEQNKYEKLQRRLQELG